MLSTALFDVAASAALVVLLGIVIRWSEMPFSALIVCSMLAGTGYIAVRRLAPGVLPRVPESTGASLGDLDGEVLRLLGNDPTWETEYDRTHQEWVAQARSQSPHPNLHWTGPGGIQGLLKRLGLDCPGIMKQLNGLFPDRDQNADPGPNAHSPRNREFSG
jgi:hypothetical protein